jgi:hypothetical protein
VKAIWYEVDDCHLFVRFFFKPMQKARIQPDETSPASAGRRTLPGRPPRDAA